MNATSVHGTAANEFMADGEWHSLAELEAAVGASISPGQALRRLSCDEGGPRQVRSGRLSVLYRMAWDRARRGQWEQRGEGSKKQWRAKTDA